MPAHCIFGAGWFDHSGGSCAARNMCGGTAADCWLLLQRSDTPNARHVRFGPLATAMGRQPHTSYSIASASQFAMTLCSLATVCLCRRLFAGSSRRTPLPTHLAAARGSRSRQVGALRRQCDARIPRVFFNQCFRVLSRSSTRCRGGGLLLLEMRERLPPPPPAADLLGKDRTRLAGAQLLVRDHTGTSIQLGSLCVKHRKHPNEFNDAPHRFFCSTRHSHTGRPPSASRTLMRQSG